MRTFSKPQRLKRRGQLTANHFCRVYDRGTKRSTWRSTGKTDRVAALEVVRQWAYEDSLGPDRREELDRRNITFEEAVTRWLSSKTDSVSPAYFQILEYRSEKFWLPYFGSRRLSEISADDVREYLRKRAAGRVGAGIPGRKIAAATTNSDLQALRCFFNWSVEEEVLTRSPARRVERHRGDVRSKVKRLSGEDEVKLLRCCREPEKVEIVAKRNTGSRDGGVTTDKPVTFVQTTPVPRWLHPLVLTAIYTGQRKSQLLRLLWSHVDLTEGAVHVPANLTKTNEDYVAPLPGFVVEELVRFRSEQAKRDARLVRKTATVFGLSSDKASISRPFQRAVARAGLGGLKFHDLRRGYVNRLRDLEIGLEVTMGMSAHKQVSTVQESYREITWQDKVEATKRLDAFAKAARA